MGKSSSQPQTPNPYTTAAAQTQSNEATAQFNSTLNNSNQYTPMGSSTWSQNGNGQWTNQQTINPAAENTLTQQQAGQGMAATAANNALGNSLGGVESPINTSSLPGIQGSVNTNFGQLANQAQQSSYNAQEALLAPQMAQQQESLQSQLAAEGAPQGSTAYNNAINNQALQNNFTQTQLANNAVQTGNAMQNQLFGQSLSAGQFQNQANQQGLQQQIALQDQPLSVYGALNGQGIQMPSFGNSSVNQANSSPTDISSDIWNAYTGQTSQANAQTASNNATTSDVVEAGAMALMMY